MRFYVIFLIFILRSCYSITPDVYNVNDNGYEYKLVYYGKLWNEAKTHCEKEGGFLALPKTEEEFKYLQTIVQAMDYSKVKNTNYKIFVWLGVRAVDCVSWITYAGDSLDDNYYNKWAKGNGGHNGGNSKEPQCAGMDPINVGLRDWWCHRPQPFICQRDHATYVVRV